jgi:hypothetical protein
LFASPKFAIGTTAVVGAAAGGILYVLNKIDPPKVDTEVVAANTEKVKIEKPNE